MAKLIQISSLENIMPKLRQDFTPVNRIRALLGESVSYQLAFQAEDDAPYSLRIESEIAESLRIYKIGCVPVMRAVWNLRTLEDGNYLSTEPGMFPDLLEPYQGEPIRGAYYYQGFWIEAESTLPAGTHRIRATLLRKGIPTQTAEMELQILPLALPPQELKYLISVHADCVAQYYGQEVFSEEHWAMLEKFIRISAKYGSNMLVPPIFTPPVDTQVGGERLTVQLVDIIKEGTAYRFGFEKFRRYIAICQDAGIRYFSMPQFFTQWGAAFAPKIMAWEDGVYKRIFGWETESTDPAYLDFLGQLIPALLEELRSLNILDRTVFSLSDETGKPEAMARYAKLNRALKPLLTGCTLMDTFSHYENFAASGMDIPVIPTDSVTEFMGKVPELFVYYCCGNDYKVSNRFINMPSWRNRSIGFQFYRYDTKGFLHWALNFYNSRLSIRPIDPYQITDSDGGFPSGDAFIVYPGAEGPLPSMRLLVFREALQDLRALKLLEQFKGREYVLALLEQAFGEVTFTRCAKSAGEFLRFRDAVMDALSDCAAAGNVPGADR